MASQDSGFLPQSVCNTIDCVLERIHTARQQLTKCERCGLPVDSIMADLTEKQSRLERIKQEFFPDNH